jgi:signal transduction histidine kinase
VRFWRSRGLRWGVAVAGVLGCSLMAMFGLMYWRTSTLLFETLDRSVVEQLALLSARPPEMLSFMIASRMTGEPDVVTRVGLFDADRGPIVGDILEVPARIRLDGRARPILAPSLTHWRAAGRVLPDGRILIVARDADEILGVQEDLVGGAIAGIVPAILLSLGAGALVGVATERRLRRLNAVAERIIAGELSERLPARADGDELDRLCVIVNRTLDRLEESVEALIGTGENIAHDLRTPLTALRARLERSVQLAAPETPLGQSIEKAILGVDQALSIVTALLRIAGIQNLHPESAFVRFDLAEIVRETVETYQPVADEKGVALDCMIATQATVRRDRQLLIEVLVNLVDNAVKFTPAGGRVSVVLKGWEDQPIVSVSDTGPGIPREARSAVFQRFYRGEASRTTHGNGLGLSLVAAVAKLHRFAVQLSDNEPGCRVDLLCWRTDGV